MNPKDGILGLLLNKETSNEDYTNTLSLLADICLSTLALFTDGSWSTRMLQETVKMIWSLCLIVAVACPSLVVDGSFMEILLDAVCDVSVTPEE